MAKEWTQEWVRDKLRDLYDAWSDCQACRFEETRDQIVFGSGPPVTDYMFIGEAPGKDENKSGVAFCGESGDLLDKMLDFVKIRRRNVFVTNIVMCQPPENVDPGKDEYEACLERLQKQIYLIDPMLIILVGKQAMKTLLKGGWSSIQEEQGKIGLLKIPGRYMTEMYYPAMPILHPSFILREDRINRETKNWERHGHADQTVRHLIRAKQIVDSLKKRYEPVRQRTRV